MLLQASGTRIYSAPIFFILLLLLGSCGGNYQAPVSEQGEQLIVNAPIIVDSSTPNSSFRVENSRPVLLSSSTEPSAATSSSSGVSSSIGSPAALSRGPIESASTSGPLSPASHRVRNGDTLFSIAFQYDLDFRSLAIANNLNPPYTIFVDQEINLDMNSISQVASAIATGNLGTAVSTNSVARASAGNSSSSVVLRQPVSSSTRAVQWQWPHQGRLLRGFQAGVNKGLDISGSTGESVFAASDGDVVYSGRGIQGTGDLIIIRHSDRYLSAYAHNSVMLVAEGGQVRAGEKIAEMGENPAGVSMLHFEIRQDGDSVDPARLLPSR